MAAVLGIHAADIKVVAVYEGSTIVDFFVQQAENIEEAIDLTSIKESFKEVVAEMDEFMGSPVLGAIAEGVVVVTKHTADLVTDDDGVFLWDEVIGDGDEDNLTPEEQEVAIEFVFKNSSNKDDKVKSDNLNIYIYGLAIIIVVMVIFVIAICCYNRYVIKINIEKTQQLQHEYQEGQGYDRRGS